MTPLERYRADLLRENFHADNAQLHSVQALQTVFAALQKTPSPVSWWRRLTRRAEAPRGVYLWGAPGRGKTYLMDSFYASLPFAEKRRVHFHRFMLEVHHRLSALASTRDPLKIVAAQMVAGQRVLCLDEFHVTDVADAMLLAGLLEEMFKHGLVLIATSNAAPDDLYCDGLQRERFLPAIGLLKRCTQVVWLAGDLDFRCAQFEAGSNYRVVEPAQAGAWLQLRWRQLAAGQEQVETALQIAGRTLLARGRTEHAVWFGFAELCHSPRSAGDYLQLACEFQTLLLQAVPQLGDEQDEAVRRFIHLIDALYDHGVKLVMTAAAEPERLYTGTRLRELFRRTASRLSEMSGAGYLARAHRID